MRLHVDSERAVRRLNELRPEDSVTRVGARTIASCLRRVVTDILEAEETSRLDAWEITQLTVQAKLQQWHLEEDRLEAIYLTAHDFLGHLGGSLAKKKQSKH